MIALEKILPLSWRLPTRSFCYSTRSIQGFLHCVWPPKMPYSTVEGGEKKNQQAHRVSCHRTGCPKYTEIRNLNLKLYENYIHVPGLYESTSRHSITSYPPNPYITSSSLPNKQDFQEFLILWILPNKPVLCLIQKFRKYSRWRNDSIFCSYKSQHGLIQLCGPLINQATRSPKACWLSLIGQLIYRRRRHSGEV